MAGVRSAMSPRTAARVAAASAVLVSALAVAGAGIGPAAAAPAELTGTFEFAAGSCAHGSISGSYIQMILPSGTTAGPYMSNSDSACSNQAYTLLTPGRDGGLKFGAYQPLPNPPFDAHGDARADSISAPAQYEGTGFATSTNPVDPQTHTKVPAPSLTVHGSTVTADLSSFSVSWNNQYFNQGAPKPDGSEPGITRTPTGTYDAKTGAMTLSWTSQVVGGPFDKFTGSWHLVGRFVPTASTTSAGSGGAVASGAAPGAATGAATGAAAGAGPGGAASAPAAASKGSGKPAKPGAAATAAPVVATASNPAATALSASVVTKHTWSVSWWLIALVLIVAAAGFGGLAALPRSPSDKPADPS
ncbi:MAG TPA: hypothetical protein VHB69_01260 [Mycobacteriales bacterium]|nr:hypothetical protein [Mycobacteriales bacterium]